MFIFMLLTMATGLAQEAAKPKFELAAVRRSDSADFGGSYSTMRGGPGTGDPENIAYHHQPLVRLVVVAYGVSFDQVSGPDWLGSELYDVRARVPLGTTKDQLRLMWQDLLAERFHLKAHIERRPFPIYELSLAKGGAKFKPAGAIAAAPEPGYPELTPGVKFGIRPSRRNIKLICQDCSVAELAERLAWPLGTMGDAGGATVGRIVDKTRLDGSYDFKLEFAGAWGPGGASLPPLPDGQLDSAPTFFDAIREQLGLNLIEKKGLLDVVVVDHADKIPTGN